jgi:four helix bundle protein
MKIEKFEDIESWKAGRELTKAIYSLTNRSAFSKDFGLRDQIQRASVSVTSNIAEGFDSKTNKAFINFLNYSFRSASEIQSLLYAALDLQYIHKDEFDLTYEQCVKVKKLIGGFIRYLNNNSKK